MWIHRWGQVSLVLYLTGLTVVPRVSIRQRLGLAFSGMPYLFLFHVFDLMMWAESRLLTEIASQHYDLGSLICGSGS
jgi:hypothetical protein